MGLLFKPFALLLGVIASRLAGGLFDRLWQALDGDPPPDPKVREDSGPRAVAATALQAGVFAGVSAAVGRYGMHVFEHLFGRWPGQRRADQADEA
ncbi:DUF4235 domain-containing protein [Patulibacter defluvii]|uniref:DUF4235 domain-containing protein n=1 Tax=Patulibacter defluvii TaxID=3095358 RepID=UPI002A74C24E|nr:DUF4235 domain-containing protein [Patulibacter sp. DM4]